MSGHGAERQTGCVCIILVARFCRLRIRNGTFRRYLRRKSRDICKTQFCRELSFFVRLNISAGSACTVPVNVSSKTSDFSINLSQLARRYSTVCAVAEVSIGNSDMPGRTIWIHVVLHAQLYPWWAVGLQVAAETNFSLLTLTLKLTSPRQGRAEQYLGARFINVYTETYSSGPRVLFIWSASEARTHFKALDISASFSLHTSKWLQHADGCNHTKAVLRSCGPWLCWYTVYCNCSTHKAYQKQTVQQ